MQHIFGNINILYFEILFQSQWNDGKPMWTQYFANSPSQLSWKASKYRLIDSCNKRILRTNKERCVVYQYQDCCYGSHWLDVPCEEKIPTWMLICKKTMSTGRGMNGMFTVVNIDTLYSPNIRRSFGAHKVIEPQCKQSKSTIFLRYNCINPSLSKAKIPNIEYIANDIRLISNINCSSSKTSISACLDFVHLTYSGQPVMIAGSVTFQQDRLIDSQELCPINSILFLDRCVMLVTKYQDVIPLITSTCSTFTLSLIHFFPKVWRYRNFII